MVALYNRIQAVCKCNYIPFPGADWLCKFSYDIVQIFIFIFLLCCWIWSWIWGLWSIKYFWGKKVWVLHLSIISVLNKETWWVPATDGFIRGLWASAMQLILIGNMYYVHPMISFLLEINNKACITKGLHTK